MYFWDLSKCLCGHWAEEFKIFQILRNFCDFHELEFQTCKTGIGKKVNHPLKSYPQNILGGFRLTCAGASYLTENSYLILQIAPKRVHVSSAMCIVMCPFWDRLPGLNLLMSSIFAFFRTPPSLYVAFILFLDQPCRL